MLNFIFKLSPKIFGITYIILVPLFACGFYLLPKTAFNTKLDIDNYLTCLYYSTVTITTLGYGDISPISNLAKILIICESLFGVIIIGLFLNSIAHMKSEIVSLSEKNKNQKANYNSEIKKLMRHNKLISENIRFYITYATIVTTPIGQRNGATFNKDFQFNDMRDLFKASSKLRDNFFKPAISYYYMHQNNFAESIRNLILNIDFSYWPNLEEECLKFLNSCKEYDFSEYIVNQPNTFGGNMKGSDLDAELISTHTGPIQFQESNAKNAYVALYFLIQQNMKFIDTYNAEILKIEQQLTE